MSLFGVHRKSDSLGAKWSTLQRDAYIWITCLSLVEQDAGTGNLSEEKIIKMGQAYYVARKAANARSDRDLSPRLFKYIATAAFLSKYAMFMDKNVEENNTTGVPEVRHGVKDDPSEQTGSDGRTLNGN